tara:strand:- start:1155 stop:1256 length:102 start_codon:yes stop_codon:yes gene_type:complete
MNEKNNNNSFDRPFVPPSHGSKDPSFQLDDKVA